MANSSRKSDIAWTAALILLTGILAAWFLAADFQTAAPGGTSRAQWYLSTGQSRKPVKFPCRIPSGKHAGYQFISEFDADPDKNMVLALYRDGQALSVQVNGQRVFTSEDTQGIGSYELIFLGRMSGSVRIEIDLYNQVPIVFGQMAQIELSEADDAFRSIDKRIIGEAGLSLFMFLTGLISLLFSKIFYKTAEESYSMNYIGWFMLLLAGWCLLRTHPFHLVGSSGFLYLLENLLLMLLPQFLIKASGLLSYPDMLRREYQVFYFIYQLYFILAVGLVILQRVPLAAAAAWSILYLCVFFIYIVVFGFFETRITLFFDRDRVILYSSLIKNLKTVIALYGCVLAFNLSSSETYYLLLVAAYYAVASFAAELLNQVKTLGRLKDEFDQSQVSLLLSQIKPHFLYNTLNSIRTLIRIQPEKADQLIYHFSRFLKANMNAIDEIMVPFSREFEHIQFYVNIEQTCFPKLKADYQIETQNFSVPSLTIQPLIENAIKHGVLKRVEGGTVRLRTYEDADAWYVEIDDDGIGFSPEHLQSKGGGIGLRNIERRLKYYCRATLYIQSALGQGTFIRVTIPKQKEEETP